MNARFDIRNQNTKAMYLLKMRKPVEKRKHHRFMKRLAIKFSVNHKIFMGMSGNLSDCGIFIKTNRDFAIDSPLDIELLLPGKQTAFLKGIMPLRKAVRLPGRRSSI